MMFACYMCSDPRFFDARTVLLLIGCGSLALVFSPSCKWLKPEIKHRLLLIVPPCFLLTWFLFQRELLLSDPMMSSFYRSMWGLTA